MAAPAAYGSSRARGQIGAAAADLHCSHSNARSLTHWARPGIEPVSSWILVGSVCAEPWWELLPLFLKLFFFTPRVDFTALLFCLLLSLSLHLIRIVLYIFHRCSPYNFHFNAYILWKRVAIYLCRTFKFSIIRETSEQLCVYDFLKKENIFF